MDLNRRELLILPAADWPRWACCPSAIASSAGNCRRREPSNTGNEKKASNFYFANLGGGIRGTADLVKLGEVCEWFQSDYQKKRFV
jgi:hypothetical protein